MRLLVTDTVAYSAGDFRETELVQDETYILSYPRTLLISLTTPTPPQPPGHFSLNYQYIDRDPTLIKTEHIEKAV
jgi:hypothetical protein